MFMASVYPHRHFENQGDTRDRLEVVKGFELRDHKPDSGAREKARFAVDRRRGYVSEISGLPNKKGLYSAVRRYCREHGLRDFDGWIVFFDVNGLKAMNDEHGHTLGNALLKATGAILKKLDGVAAHLHGDEFVAFIPKTRLRNLSTTDRVYGTLFRDRAIEKRSDRPTDLEGLYGRLDCAFASQYIVFKDTDGTVIGEFDISISRGAVEISGRRFEDLDEAIERADVLMQQNKDARKAAQKAELQAQYIDEKSGKTQFLFVMSGSVNHPKAERIIELARELGIEDGVLSDDESLGSMDPRVVQLHQGLSEAGQYDAARYLAGLVTTGKPLYRSEDVGLRGVETLGVDR